MVMTLDSHAEQAVLSVALRLFAELGYDVTTTRMIADAVGLEPAAVRAVFGGKRELYLQLTSQSVAEQVAALEALEPRLTPDADGVKLLVDNHFEYGLAHPGVPGIWMHRRLLDALDLSEVEQYFNAPVLRTVRDLISRSFKPGVDYEFAMWTLSWSIDCFLAGGMAGMDGMRYSARSLKTRRRFLAHLHGYVDMAAFPGRLSGS